MFVFVKVSLTFPMLDNVSLCIITGDVAEREAWDLLLNKKY